MDYEEMESELESAGIDPFEFSLMDEDERHEALEDALLDPWDFEDFDLEYPGGYNYSSPSVPVTPVVPKPPVTDASPVIKEPAVIPPKPEKTYSAPIASRMAGDLSHEEEKGNIYSSHKICNVKFGDADRTYPYLVNGLDLHVGDRVEVPVGATNNPVTATVVSITYSADPTTRAVIRKLPVHPPSQEPSSLAPEAIIRQQQRAEIAAIDRKMHQLRNMIIILLSLLVIIVVTGISSSNRSPGSSVPAYTIEPSASVVPYTTPTPRPSPRPTPTPMPSVPYVGMYVSSAPSKWTWQGTDNLTVKDAAGNGIRTIKYRYDAPPKIYVIWVSESTNKVVKVSVTDPTASSNRKSTTNKKSSSDPYQAKDYAHPDDFYYDYYDDFWDYEDAEDYWEKHH